MFLGITYPCAIIMGILFHLFRLCKRIRVLHSERFPRWERKIILVSNHPSLLEPFLLPALFFREYLFHPLRYGPWSTPDRKNFYDRWYWFWIRARSIPVDREDEREGLRSFFQMKEIVKSGGIVILFPEGGRTFKGENFLYSQGGKRIRIFKDGLGWLVLKTGALVLPVWVEGTDEVLPNDPDKLFTRLRFGDRIIITIKIGQPLRLQGLPAVKREQATQMIANALLKLADEEE